MQEHTCVETVFHKSLNARTLKSNLSTSFFGTLYVQVVQLSLFISERNMSKSYTDVSQDVSFSVFQHLVHIPTQPIETQITEDFCYSF